MLHICSTVKWNSKEVSVLLNQVIYVFELMLSYSYKEIIRSLQQEMNYITNRDGKFLR